jgi:vanillate/3-O-methylgallate O-demethylase
VWQRGSNAWLKRNILGCLFADKVSKDGKLAGVSTSRCYSYYFREMLSLCVIDVALATPGTAVSVTWGRSGTRQKIIRAVVAPAPYKRDNRRIDITDVRPGLRKR